MLPKPPPPLRPLIGQFRALREDEEALARSTPLVAQALEREQRESHRLAVIVRTIALTIVLFFLPWLDTSKVRSTNYRPMYKVFFWLFVVNFFVLMWVGAMPAEGIYPIIALIGSAYWFAYFLIILPLLGVIEKPLAQPATIEEDFATKKAKSSVGETAATPAE